VLPNAAPLLIFQPTKGLLLMCVAPTAYCQAECKVYFNLLGLARGLKLGE